MINYYKIKKKNINSYLDDCKKKVIQYKISRTIYNNIIDI